MPGLSPLARGTPARTSADCFNHRFIPAGAGNTCSRIEWYICHSVYPRWRGEHATVQAWYWWYYGLSPLARGTRWVSLDQMQCLRFIPAGAGNTCTPLIPQPLEPVYPRWRGEHQRLKSCVLKWGGLSPLARGTPRHRVQRRILLRFIPAGAGNTRFKNDAVSVIAVYPRWRGEHAAGKLALEDASGLSPLARGTRFGIRFLDRHERFIPAGAGNTDLP